MKNFLLIICFFIFSNKVYSQTEKSGYKTVTDRFEKFYNNQQYDSIFQMFSTDMQNASPADKTTEFLTGLHLQAGNLIKRQLIKYQSTYASYKINFEKALLTLNISIDNNLKINGLSVKPFTDESLPMPERNTTKLKLPFNGEWTVTWGGDTKELNYHVESQAQKNAFDILIFDDKKKTYKTTGQTNEDYYAFGKELFAPCDGTIVLVVDGIKDNIPGILNPMFVTGNTVIIRTNKNEFIVFAHFKQHTIKVKQDQKVKQGDLLGLCGNSGNSTQPHLHFHIQNTEDMNIATGVKCYFDKIIVNGQLKTDYSPIKNDKIKNN